MQNTSPSNHFLPPNDALADESRAELAEANRRLVETEQRLRLALESGRLGSWDLDLQTHHYAEISDLWKHHFGRPDVGNITQDEFIEFLHPDDREHTRAAAQNAIRDRHDYAAQYRAVWPDGSIHWMEANAKILYDQDNKPLRLIGVTQDITERKKREEEEKCELEEALARADRDPLTGLLNHRAFYRKLDEESARAGRDGTSFAAVLLDLGQFQVLQRRVWSCRRRLGAEAGRRASVRAVPAL